LKEGRREGGLDGRKEGGREGGKGANQGFLGMVGLLPAVWILLRATGGGRSSWKAGSKKGNGGIGPNMQLKYEVKQENVGGQEK
jgi:hypothetical protein